jgi:hypothetical protein
MTTITTTTRPKHSAAIRRWLFDASAFLDRRTENIGVFPIVISELEFRDVERQVFAADLVKGADHAPLDESPSEDFMMDYRVF